MPSSEVGGTGALYAAYRDLLSLNELRPDPDQDHAARHLDALAIALGAQEAPRGKGAGRLKRFFLRRGAPSLPALRGAYLWGGVGRGKSMLLDLFHSHAPLAHKRYAHFHEFMLEVHDALHTYRRQSQQDPIPRVAQKVAAAARLLCFDELQVTNIADAMILSRFFAALLAQGVVIVATSNRHPRDLYKDGLNRERFLPFIDILEKQFDILTLDGATDYRLARMRGHRTWWTPNGPEATAALSQTFFDLTDHAVQDKARVPSLHLQTMEGREIFVPKALKGVAVFSFKRLCGTPLWVSDYLAIARRFHTLIIVGVPRLSPDNRNEAMRFTTLIDILYEHKVKLLVAADVAPEALYVAGDGAFEFARTASRLIEMQSADYLAAGHGLSD